MKDSEEIRTIIREELTSLGLHTDFISMHKAAKIIGRHYLRKAVGEGKIPATPKIGKTSTQYVKLRDLLNYKDELISEGAIKLN